MPRSTAQFFGAILSRTPPRNSLTHRPRPRDFPQIGGFNNGFPFYVPAAVARYVSLGMLTYKIYGIVA